MLLCIADVLSPELLARVRKSLTRAAFHDGRQTAGWAARDVKANLQLPADSPSYPPLESLVREALVRNELFVLATMPKAMRPVMFNRYDTGMSYGDHVDDAIMGSNPSIRTDVSFTLFLSEPAEYEGGELILDDVMGTQSYKMPAGSLVLYPSVYLHRVEPVTSGSRLAAVGWVQCMVRDSAKRQILFDIESVRRNVMRQQGKSADFDTLSKCGSNLLRMWAEP